MNDSGFLFMPSNGKNISIIGQGYDDTKVFRKDVESSISNYESGWTLHIAFNEKDGRAIKGVKRQDVMVMSPDTVDNLKNFGNYQIYKIWDRETSTENIEYAKEYLFGRLNNFNRFVVLPILPDQKSSFSRKGSDLTLHPQSILKAERHAVQRGYEVDLFLSDAETDFECDFFYCNA